MCHSCKDNGSSEFRMGRMVAIRHLWEVEGGSGKGWSGRASGNKWGGKHTAWRKLVVAIETRERLCPRTGEIGFKNTNNLLGL